MWLLNVDTLVLEEFVGDNAPPYAILSHTWGSDEVSFVEMHKMKHREAARRKEGYSKIEGCCAQAKEDGYAWAWVDSCCIDKRSSAELSEALNSMFRWYKSAAMCYVYLSDVSRGEDVLEAIRNSRWFTRGWTLQELLASRNIIFFAKDWSNLGYMGSFSELNLHRESSGASDVSPCTDLTTLVSQVTRIPKDYLSREKKLEQACIAQRMCWASHRQTTRPEDRAYSLMGIFDINMPIMYGEGLEKAFFRLQREICNGTSDQSIFAWYHSDRISYRLLADSPDCFQNSGEVMRSYPGRALGFRSSNSAFYLTNLGLRITLPFRTRGMIRNVHTLDKDQGHARLHCYIEGQDGERKQLGLSLTYQDADLENRPIYMCRRPNTWVFDNVQGNPRSIFIRGISYDACGPEPPLTPPTYDPEQVESFVADIIANTVKLDQQYLEDDMTFSELGVTPEVLTQSIIRANVEIGPRTSDLYYENNFTIGTFREFVSALAKARSE